MTPSDTPRGRLARLRHIGPALVLATVVIGPGSLSLNTIAGSLYGYALLWVPLAATILMMVYTWLSATIALVTGETLFQVVRRRYGPALAATGGLFGFLAVLAFQAGNSAAVGFSINALFGGDVRVWALLFFFPAIGLVLQRNLYAKLEILVKVIVGLMLLAFVGTLAIVGVDRPAMAAGLVPSFPDTEAIFLTLGMAATTFSIVAAVYQGYLMREKRWGIEHLPREGVDTFAGIAILGGISIVLLLTSAGAIHGSAAPVFTAQAMAAQLEPLAGPTAFWLFTLGFFFASFSSLVVNPLIGATLLVDAFGQDASMDGRPVKRWTAVAMAAGLLVVLLFEGTPVELLRIAQGLAVVALPVLGALVLMIASDRTVMGRHRPAPGLLAIALAGYLTILGIALNYVRQIADALR
jgi:manganese transport protein